MLLLVKNEVLQIPEQPSSPYSGSATRKDFKSIVILNYFGGSQGVSEVLPVNVGCQQHFSEG